MNTPHDPALPPLPTTRLQARGQQWQRYLGDLQAYAALPQPLETVGTLLRVTGLVLGYGYILQAPLGVLSAPLRERLLGAEAVAPRRERMPSVFRPDTETGDDDEDCERG